jgi:multidrug efflux pump
MSLSSISIKRPVLATVFSLIILIFGLIGMTYLGVREFPSVDPPIITVSTSYPGANSDVIEKQITEPLEQSINGIPGIRTLTSVSRQGGSNITVEFELTVDLETAANDVRDKVSQATRMLPRDVDPPTVSKADADASPIMFIAIKSDKRSMLELSEIAELTFKEQLQTISGVSAIMIWGQKRYAMRIWIDPAKLAGYGLTPLDVRNAIGRENIELPSGRIEGNTTELTIRTLGLMSTPEEFNNLIIKQSGDQVVRVIDIGRAELGPEDLRGIMKMNGIPMVGNVIVPQPGANHIEIVDEVYTRLEYIKKDLPDDVIIEIGFDNTDYIRTSIKEVKNTIFLAFSLVVIIIFFFLRNWRTTLIPIIVIPVSLIGSFFIMYIAGFTINILTLLAIVLAIGLVVDDAIVMMENIYVKIENGMTPYEAGLSAQIAAALAVGCQGAWTGSLWLTVEEASTSPAQKQQLLDKESRDTIRSKSFTGKPCRMIRNDWTDAWERPDTPDPLPMPMQYMVSGEAVARGSRYPEQSRDVFFNPVGQTVGLMKKERKARDLMTDLVEEYLEACERLERVNAAASG